MLRCEVGSVAQEDSTLSRTCRHSARTDLSNGGTKSRVTRPFSFSWRNAAGGPRILPAAFPLIRAYNALWKRALAMALLPDNLATLKDDMIAFIEGHGMRRFRGYVDYEEVPSVIWKTDDSPESWKDFVELAKAASAPFLVMDSWRLRREELDDMIERLNNAEFTNEEDVEEARWLRTYVGKTGFVQLGFAHEGVMMVYEASTPWYDHYQRLLELSEDFGGIPIDEPGQDDET